MTTTPASKKSNRKATVRRLHVRLRNLDAKIGEMDTKLALTLSRLDELRTRPPASATARQIGSAIELDRAGLAKIDRALLVKMDDILARLLGDVQSVASRLEQPAPAPIPLPAPEPDARIDQLAMAVDAVLTKLTDLAERPAPEPAPAAAASPPEPLPLMLSTRQVADLFGIGFTTVRAWVQAGKLPPPVVDNQRMVKWSREQIEAVARGERPAESAATSAA
jgi:predicted DNA-binding transcriptional regulator AlpA